MSSEPAHAEQSRRFARAVLEAITNAGRATDAEVAAAGGPSDSYMTQLRNAAYEGAWVPPPRRSTQKRIEAAAKWAPGSAMRVWRGEDPVPDVGGSAEDAEDYVSGPGAKVSGGVSNEDLLREILRSRAEYDQLRAEVRDNYRELSERVARIEQQGA